MPKSSRMNLWPIDPDDPDFVAVEILGLGLEEE
jgi:hypothetical protein